MQFEMASLLFQVGYLSSASEQDRNHIKNKLVLFVRPLTIASPHGKLGWPMTDWWFGWATRPRIGTSTIPILW
jgi:hypothetical protein